MRLLLMLGIISLTPLAHAKTESAVLAGGCFWCLEADLDKLEGVIETVSGYDGGQEKNPSYELVSSGTTQYVESVLVKFDPEKLSYRDLLRYYYRHIDPTDGGGQFCDRGRQYRPIVFYLNPEQKQIAEEVKKDFLQELPSIQTEIIPSTTFYPAEEYHQNYYKKNTLTYKYYRWRCGRDARVEAVWKKK